MSYRIFIRIDRGMTDKTTVCVFPWEKPLIEEVHAGHAEEISIDEMASLKGATAVRKQKLKHAKAYAPDLRTQLEAMCVVDADEDPKLDLAGEYGRLIERYGMHPSVNLPVAEKVYGNVSNFIALARPYTGAKAPRGAHLPGSESVPVEDEDTPIAEMSEKELLAKAKELDIEVPKKRGKVDLEALRDALATATV
jgi:hypothetical protein